MKHLDGAYSLVIMVGGRVYRGPGPPGLPPAVRGQAAPWLLPRLRIIGHQHPAGRVRQGCGAGEVVEITPRTGSPPPSCPGPPTGPIACSNGCTSPGRTRSWTAARCTRQQEAGHASWPRSSRPSPMWSSRARLGPRPRPRLCRGLRHTLRRGFDEEPLHRADVHHAGADRSGTRGSASSSTPSSRPSTARRSSSWTIASSGERP